MNCFNSIIVTGSIGVFMSGGIAFADVASGIVGECTYVVSDDGCLTIEPTVSGAESALLPLFSNTNIPAWCKSGIANQISSVRIAPGVTPRTYCYMFQNLTELTTIDLSNFNVPSEDVVSYLSMFQGCSKLTSVVMPSCVEGQKVSSMSTMFSKCSKLQHIDFSSMYLDGTELKSMAYMFNNCASLSDIKWFGSLSTAAVTDFKYMFYGCSSLTDLDVTTLQTDEAVSFNFMFANCGKLTHLDLSGFSTMHITSMTKMFYSIKNLESLILPSSFIPSGATTTNIFGNSNNVHVYLPQSETSDAVENLLSQATNLTSYQIDHYSLSPSIMALTSQWHTYCYPLALPLPNGVIAYRAVSLKDGKVVLASVPEDQGLPANTPLVLQNKTSGTVRFPLPMVLDELPTDVIRESGNLLCGTYQKMTAIDSTYVLQNQNGVVAFYKVGCDGGAVSETDVPTVYQYTPYNSDVFTKLDAFSDEFEDGFNTDHWKATNESFATWSFKEENVSVSDGKLSLTMKYEPHTKNNSTQLYFTSGMLRSTAPVGYGYYEACIKGAVIGTCPAFWLYTLPSDSKYVLPREENTIVYNEIDIIELQQVASNYDILSCNMHVWVLDENLNNKQYKAGQYPELGKNEVLKAGWNGGRDEFHIYAVENRPDSVVFYVDNQRVASKPNYYWHMNMYLTLSLGLRTPFEKYENGVRIPIETTAQEAEDAGFPTSQQVKYVRSWTRDYSIFPSSYKAFKKEDVE